MGKPVALQSQWGRGMVSDLPRNQLPKGASFRIIDYLVNVDGAGLRKRGGWDYFSADLSLTHNSTTSVISLGLGEAEDGTRKLIVFAQDGHAMIVADDGTVTDISGAGPTKAGVPFSHRGKLLVPNGGDAPFIYLGDGTVSSFDATDTPPSAKAGCVFKDYSILAFDDTNSRRIWFSNPGDPTKWDTAVSFVETIHPGVGVAALGDLVIAFGDHTVERFVGTTPPPDSDFQRRTIHNVGCADLRSIAQDNDGFVFANGQGVFRTDGSSLLDVTALTGLEQEWRSFFGSDDREVAGSIFRGHYIVSIFDGNGVFLATFVFDLINRIGMRLKNINARAFALGGSGVNFAEDAELYMGLAGKPRVAKLSPIWTPSAQDDDGTVILPALETSFYDEDAAGVQARIGRVYVGYVCEDPSSGVSPPHLKVSVATDPTSETYEALTDTLPALDDYDRKRIPIRKKGRGFSLKVEQVGASTDTAIFEIAAEVRKLEESK